MNGKSKTKDTSSNWVDFKKNAPNVYYYIRWNLAFYWLDLTFIAIVVIVSILMKNRFVLKLATMPVCMIETFAIAFNIWGYL